MLKGFSGYLQTDGYSVYNVVESVTRVGCWAHARRKWVDCFEGKKYYNEFLGWANEFDLASIPRKQAILAELFEKVEVGRGYKVTIHVKGSYKQFVSNCQMKSPLNV